VGLPVSGPLSEFRAVARARVVVPGEWRRESTPAGRLRFLTPGVPSPNAARLLDGGVRGATAFRVIRPERSDQRVGLRGLRTSVLTRRTDIVPAGQVAWSDVTVSAISRPGDECHSGTYRNRMGPQLGDALATARTTLTFDRP
jgi:hypothetical protein